MMMMTGLSREEICLDDAIHVFTCMKGVDVGDDATQRATATLGNKLA